MTRCCSILFSRCTIGLGLSSSERKRLSHVLTSMHVAISDQQIGKSFMDNWTFKNFIERYAYVCTVLHIYVCMSFTLYSYLSELSSYVFPFLPSQLFP